MVQPEATGLARPLGHPAVARKTAHPSSVERTAAIRIPTTAWSCSVRVGERQPGDQQRDREARCRTARRRRGPGRSRRPVGRRPAPARTPAHEARPMPSSLPMTSPATTAQVSRADRASSEHAAAQVDACVGEGEHRDDDVARRRVQPDLQPLVDRHGAHQLAVGGPAGLDPRRLAEGPEPRRRAFDRVASGFVGCHQQAAEHARDGGVQAGLQVASHNPSPTRRYGVARRDAVAAHQPHRGAEQPPWRPAPRGPASRCRPGR